MVVRSLRTGYKYDVLAIEFNEFTGEPLRYKIRNKNNKKEWWNADYFRPIAPSSKACRIIEKLEEIIEVLEEEDV